VILKLECLEYIYKYYFIVFYIHRAILTQTNPKKGLIEKKSFHMVSFCYLSNNFKAELKLKFRIQNIDKKIFFNVYEKLINRIILL